MIGKLKNAFKKVVLKEESWKELKISFFGYPKCGRTIFLIRLFLMRYDLEFMTYDEPFRRGYQIEDKSIVVEVYDIPPIPFEVPDLRNKWICESNCFVFVYSILSKTSFLEIEKEVAKVCEMRNRSNIPMMILGTMLDLEEEREVPKEQGQALAKRLGALCFFEVSSKTGVNCHEAFMEFLRMYLEYEKFEKQKVFNCKMAVMTILCLRWFGGFGILLPKEIFVLIAKMIWYSRYDDCWIVKPKKRKKKY